MQETTTSQLKPEPSTSESRQVLTTQEPIPEPITSQLKPEPSTSESRQVLTTQEPFPETTTSQLKPEPSTSQPRQMPTTQEPIPEPSTSESRQMPTTQELFPETTTSQLKPEPSTSQPRQVPTTQESIPELTTSMPKQEISTSKPPTSEAKPEPTTSEQKSEASTSETKPEDTTSEPKYEPTTSEQATEPTTSEPKKEPTTSEVKTTQYSIATTSINKPKTEAILTTIFNHVNLTSIASTEVKIPTTIIETKIKTTITEYGLAYAVLVGLSNFLQFVSYFSFHIHFRSVRGFIYSYALTMTVQLINNRLLRVLENHQAHCEKVDEDLENASYLCNVVADVSNVSSIKIESDFNFESQDVIIVGISPVSHALMDNVQNAIGEYNNLLESYIYVLDHSNITANKRYKTLNISGIIDNPKFNLSNNNLTLLINVEKEEDILEEEVNCTIYNINGSNYTLNCLGKKNILYNLQSAVSFLENDILLINFDENITSKIIFESGSNRLRKKDTNSLSAGAIVAIVLVLVIVLAILAALIALRKKLFLEKSFETVESTIVSLKTK